MKKVSFYQSGKIKDPIQTHLNSRAYITNRSYIIKADGKGYFVDDHGREVPEQEFLLAHPVVDLPNPRQNPEEYKRKNHRIIK